MGVADLKKLATDHQAVPILKRKDPDVSNDSVEVADDSMKHTPDNMELDQDEPIDEYELTEPFKTPEPKSHAALPDSGKRRQLDYPLFECKFCEKAIFDNTLELDRHVRTDYQCSRLAQSEERKVTLNQIHMLDNLFESASNLPRDQLQTKKMLKVIYKEAQALFKELEKSKKLTIQQQITYAEGLGMMKVLMKYGQLQQ